MEALFDLYEAAVDATYARFWVWRLSASLKKWARNLPLRYLAAAGAAFAAAYVLLAPSGKSLIQRKPDSPVNAVYINGELANASA